MAHWQQKLYDPWLVSAVTKHMPQWRTTMAEMTKNIMKETKTEMEITMLLPDQDLMVRSSIQSKLLGLTEEHWAKRETLLGLQHTFYPRVGIYIYPINTILMMCHKLLYEKIGVLDLCCWNTKKHLPVELIIKYTAYLICTGIDLSLSAPSLV